MEKIDNQSEYWDNVADQKNFTHTLDTTFLNRYFNKNDKILDYGCGYGRIVNQLINRGFFNIKGYDTSINLIKRGKTINPECPIQHIKSLKELNIDNESVKGIVLFAVLTCIPSNAGQEELINYLHEILELNGIIYLSDYYLQPNSKQLDRYQYLNGDPSNYGVFTLPEGVTFRHHTKDWIHILFKKFKIIEEKQVKVLTMNGHEAECFQIIAQK